MDNLGSWKINILESKYWIILDLGKSISWNLRKSWITLDLGRSISWNLNKSWIILGTYPPTPQQTEPPPCTRPPKTRGNLRDTSGRDSVLVEPWDLKPSREGYRQPKLVFWHNTVAWNTIPMMIQSCQKCKPFVCIHNKKNQVFSARTDFLGAWNAALPRMAACLRHKIIREPHHVEKAYTHLGMRKAREEHVP